MFFLVQKYLVPQFLPREFCLMQFYIYEIGFQDSLVETAKEEASSISNIIAQATK